MRFRWLFVAIVLASIGPDRAVGQVEVDLGAQPVEVAPPAVEARNDAAELAAALAILPPGVRLPQQPGGTLTERTTDFGATLVERIHVGSDGARDLEVEYTIDPLLDSNVREILKRGNVSLGHVIVLDPKTGEVFSYVSTDPARFSATRTYPTASLMKVVTAAAVLHDAPAAAERDCRYIGSPYQLDRGDLKSPKRGGRVNSFEHAIAISNNQCFARLAVDDVGEVGMLAAIERAGLLEAPGVAHPAGHVDPIGGPLELGYLGSGLAGSQISPLAAARLAAVLARGELITPYWISRIREADGSPLVVPGRAEARAAWSPDVADRLRGMMLSVTSVGTASRAFRNRRGLPLLGEVEVSGKTGTLTGTDPPGRYQWFIGVAPASDPSVAIAAVVVDDDRPASGATDIAARTLQQIFCDGDVCDAANSEWLTARVRLRESIAAEAAAREREALAKAAREREAELARLYDAHELDEIPRLLGEPNIDLPRRLLRSRARGKIVLMIDLDRDGAITGAEIDSSDLPRFNEVILEQVKTWKFSPPTREGRPVLVRTRLPIPIKVN